MGLCILSLIDILRHELCDMVTQYTLHIYFHYVTEIRLDSSDLLFEDPVVEVVSDWWWG